MATQVSVGYNKSKRGDNYYDNHEVIMTPKKKPVVNPQADDRKEDTLLPDYNTIPDPDKAVGITTPNEARKDDAR